MKARMENDGLVKLAIFAALGMLCLVAWMSGAMSYRKFAEVDWFIIFTIVYSLLVFLHLLYRAILTVFYKPCEIDPQYHPSLSIIIPAYNEGDTIKKCLASAIYADYPGSKEIICVNDGSTDDTANHIREVLQRYPGAFTFLDFSRNRGKREAMASGAEIAKGEIVVLVDSDTCIQEDALSALVAPFKDAKVGATTGAVRVLNEDESFLTKVMSVRYTIAFDFYRVSHSVFKTVMVCSGVLSAYRRTLFDSIKDAWLNQMFLGKKCTYGDDRSLTNFVIRSGYDTIYTRDAVAYTMAPPTISKLVRMILRWNKSYIRESFIFLSFMFKKINKSYKHVAIFDFVLSNSLMMLQYVALISSIVFFFIHPMYILKFLTTITLFSSIYMLFYIRIKRNTDFVYGFVYSYMFVFVLCWTLPYAFFTLKDDSWLTR